MKTDDEKYGGATADEVIDSMQEEIGRLQAECDGAGRVIASLIVERDEERFERKALQIVIDGQNDVIKLRVRERDEALAELQHARDLIGETVGMSYYTAAEIGVRDYTHSLPSAMLGVIRERDEAIANLKLGTMEMVLADKAAAEAERDRLREYVGRLEAALVGFASAIDGQVALDDSHTCEDGDECSQHCLACHETIRLHHAEADAEQRILALGREIAGRKL